MSTALYRRYRPETFAEVIGQEHVTGPLSVALDRDRVSHAYLFSGPRGCGKTTSARILARCLNCVNGPTSTPCGECDSCVALARGGSGSLDVIEIDAASHRGIDDAREIRDRAIFAPASSRFKIFIIDEAHMVTKEGFNALLKIVEEPPAHVKFVFATTEPDKVIGTIRSRTHHYPFRLVPPPQLQDYLGQLCTSEGVEVGPGVLPLVVRAGGGSVRDTLSVLDQLLAGAGDEGVDYAVAIALLGYTDAALLDDVVEAIAAGDGRTAFRMVERVVDSGLDPRRFVEDLLERLRDLLVVAAVPDGAHAVLRGLPADQLQRMAAQAGSFGAAELSRAADVCNAALTEMTGATSPRLHLELLVARLLLPGADDAQRGLPARLDRLERRIGMAAPVGSAPVAPAPVVSAPVAPAPVVSAPVVSAPVPSVAAHAAPSVAVTAPASVAGTVGAEPGLAASSPSRPSVDEPPASHAVPPAVRPGDAAGAGQHSEATTVPSTVPEATEQARSHGVQPSAAPTPPAPSAAPAASGRAGGGAMDVVGMRAAWPGVLESLRPLKRATWALLTQDAQVLQFDGRHLVLGFSSTGLATSFSRGTHQDLLRQALTQHLGIDCSVEGVAAGGAAPAPAPVPAATAPPAVVPAAAPPSTPAVAPPPRPEPSASASPPTPAPVAPAPAVMPSTPEAVSAPAPGAVPAGGDTSWPTVRAIPTGPFAAASASPAPPAAPSRAARPFPTSSAPSPAPSVSNPTRPAAPTAGGPAPRPEPAPASPGARSGRPERAPRQSPPPHDDVPWPDEPPPDDVPPPPEDWERARPAARPPAPAPTASPGSAPGSSPASSSPGPSAGQAQRNAPARPAPAQPAPTPAARPTASSGAALARAAARAPVAPPAQSAPDAGPEDEPSRDDVEVEGSGLVGAAVVSQLLGGTVIEERSE